MRYRVDRMSMADLPRVVEIERLAYSAPWPPSAYRKELQENQYAHYIVVRDTWAPDARPTATPAEQQSRRHFALPFLAPRAGPPLNPSLASIVGFAGLWLMVDEAHITTIAMHPVFRGQGLGELLLCSLVGIAYEIHAHNVTLEVRVSNETAKSLYRKYGFAEVGIRRRYYSDNHEDAAIMTTDDISSPGYRDHYARLRDALLRRLAAQEAPSPAGGQPGAPA
ncbi:MAG TPA: ribosomal protein S18-alanine N-acetyltransferase [Ktedonobacterales bacterium]|nr:ribosomal protein S18-alanine N-acetyltransferase [Ktedonobacterales bacterium]